MCYYNLNSLYYLNIEINQLLKEITRNYDKKWVKAERKTNDILSELDTRSI